MLRQNHCLNFLIFWHDMELKRTFALKAYTFPLVSLPYKNICYLSSSLLLYFRYAQVTVLVTEIIKSPPPPPQVLGSRVESPLPTEQKPK